VTSEKNNGQHAAFAGERSLQFNPIDAGHHEIEHQTPRFVQVVLREKFAGRRKRGYNEASRAQKARKRFPHRRLIVHDENGWRVWFGCSGHCSSMIPVIL
jgi:hypothetical protein